MVVIISIVKKSLRIADMKNIHFICFMLFFITPHVTAVYRLVVYLGTTVVLISATLFLF